ncbi:MAG: TetR family transcriptional regulator [Pseudomonadota bacterium]
MDVAKVNQERIVTEAISLLKKEGLDGVSLRKIAERVGVKAPSLYWHFKDKSALLTAVMEQIFGECLDSIRDQRDWRKWMRAFGLALWHTQGSLRDFGRLITTTDMDAAALQRTTDRIRTKLQNLDLPEQEAMEIQSGIQALTTGWTAFAHAPYARALGGTIDFDKAVRRDLDALIDGRAMQIARRTNSKRRRTSP